MYSKQTGCRVVKNRNPSNSKDLKILNRILVRNVIRRMEPIARYELAKETGLTPPTVTVIVNQLMEEGVVIEIGFGESSGGRRPVMLELNPETAYILAIQLQKGDIVTAIFDVKGNLLKEQRTFLNTDTPEDVIGAIGDSCDSLICDTQIDQKRILAIGLATPGLVNSHRGLVERSANLGWSKVPLGSMLSKRLNGIPVRVENISNAAALAEKTYGSGIGLHDLIYLNLSVGIGAGIIIDGEIYRGTTGYAGEIGHMTLIPNGGPKCTCGRSGCLESLCGVLAILEQIKKALPSPEFEKHSLIKDNITMRDLLHSTLLEHKIVQNIIRETGKWTGIATANLVSLFNPQMIILGGEVSKVGVEFIEEVKNEMNNRILKEFITTVKVVQSNLKENPPLLGAYAQALEGLFSLENWDL